MLESAVTTDVQLSDLMSDEVLGAVFAGLIEDDRSEKLTDAEDDIAANPSAYAERGAYSEIVRIGTPEKKYLASASVRKRFAEALPPEFFTQHSKRCSTHRCTDLYGYAHTAGLAVYQVREGSWDRKYNFGESKKRYILVDTNGEAIEVPHGKIRGAARSRSTSLEAPVLGALRDAFAMTPDAASKLLAKADGRLKLADIRRERAGGKRNAYTMAEIDAAFA